uniref:Tc1-like transposase DDE domain-containing protein n=1 Tax=Caenorhabditis japonica TaxID=281687 RepID=A0A8R1DKE4_CAEJA
MGRGKTLTMPERAQVDWMNIKKHWKSEKVETTRSKKCCKSSVEHHEVGKDVGAEIQLKVSKSTILRTIKHHAPNHEANPYNSTRAFLASKKIKVLDWPACSPDLNPIESVWDILARSVYKNGKQCTRCNSICELKDAVKTEWSKIHPSYLENLSNSMPNRIF